MSESTYKSHPIWSTLKTLDDLLANEKFSQPSVSGSEQISFNRDKIISLIKLIRQNLEQTPAVLVSTYWLDQLNANLQSNVTNQITAFVTNNTTAHIDAAANFLDQSIYTVIGNCFPKSQDLGKKAISESFEAIRTASVKAIQLLDSEKTNLVEKINSQNKLIIDFQARIENLSEVVAVQKTEAMSVTALVQKEFAESEAKRLTEFKNQSDEFYKSFKNHESASKLAASELIEKIEKNRNDGADLLKALGDDGVTGNYRIIAASESKQANVMRNITFGVFGLGIFIALCTLWKFLETPFTSDNAWSALIRLLYAIAITTPAWYAAKESARHRSNADRARQTELELASLGPFIELMPADKKTLIREELIKTYFGNKIDKHEVAAPIQTKDLTDLATTAIKALSK